MDFYILRGSKRDRIAVGRACAHEPMATNPAEVAIADDGIRGVSDHTVIAVRNVQVLENKVRPTVEWKYPIAANGKLDVLIDAPGISQRIHSHLAVSCSMPEEITLLIDQSQFKFVLSE